MRLFPRNIDFFRFFENQIDEIQKAAKLFGDLKNHEVAKYYPKIKAVEHQTDEITHDIIKNLNQTFITPIDREDITLLASHLDSVIDELDMAVSRLLIYKIKPVPAKVFEYGRLIEKSVKELAKAIGEFRNHRSKSKVLECCEKINSLENETDDLHRKNLQELFEKQKNAIKIMKLKEVYEALERVTDRCEDVANTLEAIWVKNL